MSATRPMWMLALFAAACTALLAGTWSLARERIEAERRRSELAALAALLPPGYDNDPIADRITLAAEPELGGEQPVTVYRARRQGQPLGAVFQAIAPDGYSGAIALLVGVGPPRRAPVGGDGRHPAGDALERSHDARPERARGAHDHDGRSTPCCSATSSGSPMPTRRRSSRKAASSPSAPTIRARWR